MGGRVVEGARLERVYGCKPIEGSNPSLSASSTDPRACKALSMTFCSLADDSVERDCKLPNSDNSRLASLLSPWADGYE